MGSSKVNIKSPQEREILYLRPSKKLKTVWRARILLAFALVVALSSAVDMLSFTAAVLLFSILTLVLLACFIFIPFYYESILYSLDESTLYRMSGIFFKKHTAIVKVQILYSTSVSTPLLRLFGLKTLYFYGCGARLRLSALENDDMALLLRGVDEL